MTWMEQIQPVNWGQVSGISLGAYLLGCFTTGYYLVRSRTGQDIRELGSGSVGAKNVGRVLGGWGFTVTFLGDFAKGLLAVWAARHFARDAQDAGMAAVALLAVVAGHIWPVQLLFRGGKGAATAFGGLLAYDPALAAAFALLFAVGALPLRRTVLPGMFAFGALPLVSLYLGREPAKVAGLTILAGLIWISHRKNLWTEVTELTARRHGRLKDHPPNL